MKILFEHANYFAFTKDKQISERYTNCLVARICAEEGDDSKMEEIVDGIDKIYKHLKPDSLALFPFAHLSSDILEYKLASNLFKLLATRLQEKEMLVLELPFGTNKGYDISIKEHKLNNIFRHY